MDDYRGGFNCSNAEDLGELIPILSNNSDDVATHIYHMEAVEIVDDRRDIKLSAIKAKVESLVQRHDKTRANRSVRTVHGLSGIMCIVELSFSGSVQSFAGKPELPTIYNRALKSF